MTQSFTCYSVYLFIIWFRNLMRSIHVYLTSFEQSSKFHAAPGISKCRAHASLPFGRTYVHNFLYVLYLHWSPNPKCCLIPVKPSSPHMRRLEPVYYDVAPHAVVLLQTLPPHSSSVFFKRMREKPICSGGAFKKKDLQWRPLPQGALGSCRTHHCFLFSLHSCALQ